MATSSKVSPKLQDYLTQVNEAGKKANAQGIEATPETARAALASLNQFNEPQPKISEVKDTEYSYDNEGEEILVPLRIYNPNPAKKLDTIIFVHGGGHMCGDLDIYDNQVRKLAEATEMLTVSVFYRRSPEYKYPAGVEDTYAVFKDINEIVSDYKTTGNFYAVGDSGGGATIASVGQRAIKDDFTKISKQALIYPSLDYTLSQPSVETYAEGYFLDKDRTQWYFDNYFQEGADRKQASPVFGPFSATMPETLVISAGCDILQDEGKEYVNQINEAGGKAKYILMSGMIHAYLFFETMVSEECTQTYKYIAEFLKSE
ncbi:MAG: alpha/beta hydrolase [Micrococcaceae bacterium]